MSCPAAGFPRPNDRGLRLAAARAFKNAAAERSYTELFASSQRPNAHRCEGMTTYQEVIQCRSHRNSHSSRRITRTGITTGVFCTSTSFPKQAPCKKCTGMSGASRRRICLRPCICRQEKTMTGCRWSTCWRPYLTGVRVRLCSRADRNQRSAAKRAPKIKRSTKKLKPST